LRGDWRWANLCSQSEVCPNCAHSAPPALFHRSLPRVGLDGLSVSVNWRVLSCFTVVLSLLAGIVFLLIPALHGSRADVTGSTRRRLLSWPFGDFAQLFYCSVY
jgi:hypothetical protein